MLHQGVLILELNSWVILFLGWKGRGPVNNLCPNVSSSDMCVAFNEAAPIFDVYIPFDKLKGETAVSPFMQFKKVWDAWKIEGYVTEIYMCRWQGSIERMLGGNIQYLRLHLGSRMIDIQWVWEKFPTHRKSCSSSLFCHTTSPLQVSQKVLYLAPHNQTQNGHSPLPPPILTFRAFTNSSYQLVIIPW